MEKKRDEFLESLYETLSACDLVLKNQAAFGKELAMKAAKIRKETQEYISSYESRMNEEEFEF